MLHTKIYLYDFGHCIKLEFKICDILKLKGNMDDTTYAVNLKQNIIDTSYCSQRIPKYLQE